jgi:hypothetical protein
VESTVKSSEPKLVALDKALPQIEKIITFIEEGKFNSPNGNGDNNGNSNTETATAQQVEQLKELIQTLQKDLETIKQQKKTLEEKVCFFFCSFLCFFFH